MTVTQPARTVDMDRLNTFMGQAIGDLGATISGALVLLGDRLGLYAALRGGAPTTVDELAQRTGTAPAYLRPWLANQAAGGYLQYDAATETWSLTPEQELALAVPDGPAFFPGSMQIALGVFRDLDAIEARFRSGAGFGWHEHDANLFEGTERFFRPGYVANLVPTWLPGLDGVLPKLERGALVLDIGCGHGASTILMAQAFPASRFVGLDYHEASIAVARRQAAAAGVADRVTFETADATEPALTHPALTHPALTDPAPTDLADLITMFDCLHDMGDPEAAARAARERLAPDGTLMVVEPLAADRLEDNLHPLGRVFYGASTAICTPASLSQPGARALGPQAGPAVLSAVLRDAGFSRVRVTAGSAINLILEARP